MNLNDQVGDNKHSLADANEQEQITLVPLQAPTGQMDSVPPPSSQAGFIASYSDDLFHPVSNGPSSQVYSLPPVPCNPNSFYHAYNQQSNRIICPLPSILSSYNNPTFSIPPLPSNTQQYPSKSIRPLGPPPPIPPHINTPLLSCTNQPGHNYSHPYYPAYCYDLVVFGGKPGQSLVCRFVLLLILVQILVRDFGE